MIYDDGDMAIIGTELNREIGILSCGEIVKATKEVTLGTPNPRRSGAGCITDRGDVSQKEALSKSDESVISVKNQQRLLTFGGSDPFMTASRVLKLLSK